jgi:hopanoid biosynthesis associated RND transporter like protein HpnN
MKQEPTHPPPTLAARLLARLVAAAGRFPRTVLALGLAAAALSLALFLTRLEYRTHRNDLINPSKDYLQRWQKYQEVFGEDVDLVVVVQGGERPRIVRALDHLAAAVGRQPDLFDRLFYRVDLRHLQGRALLYLSPEQIAQIQENLRSMRLLLETGSLGWRSLTLGGLLVEARQRLGRLTPGEPLSPADEQFLTQLAAISRAAAATLDDPASYKNPWGSLLAAEPGQADKLAVPQYFFSGDGKLAFLLARPTRAAGADSFDGARPSVEAMRAIVADARAAFPDLEIGLTGLPVLESDEMVAARRDSAHASWLAIAGVTLLFFLVYRGIRYPLLTVSTLLLGTSWAMGWLTLTVGHLNILSATFAVMLIGMGDYGVLWVMRYEQERRGGSGVAEALRQTSLCVGGGTVTAALTTALAFYAAMLADFQAVAELGWIAGSGVLLCALACFTVLPAALTLFDRRTFAAGRSPAVLPMVPTTPAIWLPWLTDRPRLVLTAGLGLAILLSAGASRLRYDHNLLHLQARDLEAVRWELRLIDHTAGASWHALSYRNSPAEALALKAKYEQLPEVSMVVEVASLVPRDQAAKLPLVRDIRERLRYLPPRGERVPHGRPSVDLVHTEVMGLLLTLGKTPPPAGPGGRLLAELTDHLRVLHERFLNGRRSDREAEGRLQEFEERLAGDLAADLHRLREVATPEPITVADLPPSLRERYVGRDGQYLLQVFGKDSLWDFGPLDHFARRIQTVDPEATGKPFSTVEGLRAMKDGFIRAGVYAFLAIALVLFLDFRSLRRTLVALSPLALGIVFALGAMGLCAVPLNPANMIALPLILGVGVDNGVHVLHDFLADKAEGRRRLSRAIGRGVLVKALTTMIGFGTLMIASHRGMVGLGFALSLGVGCCMVTALVFLPALLRFLSDRPQPAAAPADPPAPPVRELRPAA